MNMVNHNSCMILDGMCDKGMYVGFKSHGEYFQKFNIKEGGVLMKIRIMNHDEKIADRYFPYDGYLSAENGKYIYVLIHFPNYQGKNPKITGYAYDKTGGFWMKQELPVKVAVKCINYVRTNKTDQPVFIKTMNAKVIEKMMKQVNRKHKKQTGGRYYENPYQQTQDLRYRGYTDESHWTGIVGSRVAHYARYGN